MPFYRFYIFHLQDFLHKFISWILSLKYHTLSVVNTDLGSSNCNNWGLPKYIYNYVRVQSGFGKWKCFVSGNLLALCWVLMELSQLKSTSTWVGSDWLNIKTNMFITVTVMKNESVLGAFVNICVQAKKVNRVFLFLVFAATLWTAATY